MFSLLALHWGLFRWLHHSFQRVVRQARGLFLLSEFVVEIWLDAGSLHSRKKNRKNVIVIKKCLIKCGSVWKVCLIFRSFRPVFVWLIVCLRPLSSLHFMVAFRYFRFFSFFYLIKLRNFPQWHNFNWRLSSFVALGKYLKIV